MHVPHGIVEYLLRLTRSGMVNWKWEGVFEAHCTISGIHVVLEQQTGCLVLQVHSFNLDAATEEDAERDWKNVNIHQNMMDDLCGRQMGELWWLVTEQAAGDDWTFALDVRDLLQKLCDKL